MNFFLTDIKSVNRIQKNFGDRFSLEKLFLLISEKTGTGNHNKENF